MRTRRWTLGVVVMLPLALNLAGGMSQATRDLAEMTARWHGLVHRAAELQQFVPVVAVAAVGIAGLPGEGCAEGLTDGGVVGVGACPDDRCISYPAKPLVGHPTR